MSGEAETTGNLATALTNAAQLIERDPVLAEEQAREILKVVPGHPEALRLLASALRLQGRVPEAVDILSGLAKNRPSVAAIQLEYALALGDAGRTRDAVVALRRVVQLEPRHAQAWRQLGDCHVMLGNTAAADDAYARHIEASVNDPQLLQAAAALCERKLAVAERLLREFLKEHPTDVAAIRMLAETGTRLGRYADAETLLFRCLRLAPSFTPARHNYATVLYRQNKAVEALEQIAILLAKDPRNPTYRTLKAAALGRVGDYQQAIELYVTLLEEYPHQPKAWMSYGHTLKTVGRTADGIEAYRKSIALLPSLGEAYWSLANLKTVRFEADDILAMREQLARDDLDEEDRIHLHFALGKALEDAREYRESFEQYDKGNALRQAGLSYDPQDISGLVERSRAFFTPEFFARRKGWGCKAPDPIFIVGMTRAGSTLLEQILASHSMIEGTMELPDIIALARRFSGKRKEDKTYPATLEGLDAATFEAIGAEYLARTRVQRKLGRPHFVDKMPNNWAYVGFIQSILPNARIIDARRHPLACCFSNFKQLFARGQGFSYSLADMGRYYADYVRLMAHFDAVLPGRVHRVIHEDLVRNPEQEIRRILDYCGLPFEEQCLRFHETDRAIRTASSEQVRQPLSSENLEHWRNFEPWLGALKAALGPVLDYYPAAPALSD
ncbi:MAG TPA: sulfotransferase [Rhizomicrobium sp.]|nr:sulfotransferase [Rhizomicrobium sp.]